MENEIREAVVKFESLLRQQLERQERMEQAAPEKDYSGMKTITVGLIDGDGIGPIIMKQAERVLEKLLADDIASGRVVLKKIEGLTIENRLALGQVHGGGGDLVAPDDGPNLVDEHPLYGRGHGQVLIELLLWDASVEFR